ncbi:Uncharacterized protein APZ42_013716 [Daphnia magna]|uniref:Uncharacterized protein n=1 Tax=Daphnia magna TaxID=35525 RepID=A0A162QKE7_9CRUS|nr:Uncharacterized protein APZ42_013716 [Daphnia magna]
MDTDDVEASGGEATKKPRDPEVYKTRRSTTKRLFTRTVNSVEQKINSEASRDTMTLLKEIIQELMNQCLYRHSRYLSAIAPTGDSLNTEEQWEIRTDTAARDAFKLIDDYLNTIQSDEAPNGGVKRPANDKGDSSVVLAEAKKKRMAAEEALKITEEETNKKIEEI